MGLMNSIMYFCMKIVEFIPYLKENGILLIE